MRGDINDMLHFSIDDVSGCFRWIHKNKPRSVFVEPMFEKLLQWHDKYGLNVDCYVYEENNEFNIKDMEKRYWDELKLNAKWLRFGWHQIGPDIDLYDVASQIASARRVSKFLKEKCSVDGFSKALRLHNFAGEIRLIEALKEIGYTILLTADSEGRSSYSLTEQELTELWKKGNYYCREMGILYKITDLRMDLLSSSCTVDDMMKKAYDHINLCPSNRSLEVFCHEWKFPEISKGIEQFLCMIGGVKKRIYLNAVAKQSNTFYFTDACSSSLFKFDIKKREINNVSNLPLEANGSRYASLHIHKNKLWMVPWNASNLLVYDFVSAKLSEIVMPVTSKYSQIQLKCRKAVEYGKYLWLLLYSDKVLVKIDMEEYKVEFIDSFPYGVTFDKSKGMNFKCMDILGDKMYLFSDSCSHNLRVDAVTGEMEIWNNDFNSTFGIMLDENRALLPPIREDVPLRIYHSDTRTFEETYPPGWIFRGTEIYAFWYCCRTKDYIYVMPHEANGIIRYSLKHDRIEFIQLPNIHYYTLRNNPGFSGYEVLEESDRVWLFPYSGSQILCMEKDARVSDICDLEVSLAQFYEMMWRDKCQVCESHQASLCDFLEEVNTNSIERHVMRDM